jgi:hypothetical protein
MVHDTGKFVTVRTQNEKKEKKEMEERDICSTWTRCDKKYLSSVTFIEHFG